MVLDRAGKTARCSFNVTIEDNEALEGTDIDCNITDYNKPGWHFHPYYASISRQLWRPVVAQLQSPLSQWRAPRCENCNGANKLESLTCNGITTIAMDTLRITDINVVRNFFRQKVMASSRFNAAVATQHFGIRIHTFNNRLLGRWNEARQCQ